VPIGSTQPVRIDVRIIAAANRDLPTEVAEGRFRADLFYRLNVFPLALRPCATGWMTLPRSPSR
jgi:two-component system response regulator FlrC